MNTNDIPAHFSLVRNSYQDTVSARKDNESYQASVLSTIMTTVSTHSNGFSYSGKVKCSDVEGPVPVQQLSSCPKPSEILHLRKMSLNSEHTDEQMDDDPFLLLPQAKVWLRAERERYKPRTNCCGGLPGGGMTSTYSPYESKNGKIPNEAYSDACDEFYRRFMMTGDDDDDKNSPSVLLVARNVAEDWMPPESVRGRFLFFPRIKGKSALFLTYMPGPKHGAVDEKFIGKIGTWHDTNDILSTYLMGGVSSGGAVNKRYRGFEPDLRKFPKVPYRDPKGNDSDPSNKGLPYSRFIWEIEYKNRDPVEIRQRGFIYMRSEYTRYFLAGKFYPREGDGTFQAAVVLWGKPDESSNDVQLIVAVSIGSAGLDQEHEMEFSQAGPKSLVGVGVNEWRRPEDENDLNWIITIPASAFLYKVAKGERVQENGELAIVYVTDEIDGDEVQDFTINLQELRNAYEGLAGQLPRLPP